MVEVPVPVMGSVGGYRSSSGLVGYIYRGSVLLLLRDVVSPVEHLLVVLILHASAVDGAVDPFEEVDETLAFPDAGRRDAPGRA